jgi:hypothetical protein
MRVTSAYSQFTANACPNVGFFGETEGYTENIVKPGSALSFDGYDYINIGTSFNSAFEISNTIGKFNQHFWQRNYSRKL